MADYNNPPDKLDGVVSRFEEVSTLITDPNVIGDQKRYVKLTKEYKDLEKLTGATRLYRQLLGNIKEAREVLDTENDEDLRAMAETFAADYEDMTGKAMEIVVGTVEDTAEGEFYFELTDDEMREYYASLAAKHGGRITGRYRNAIYFILDEEHHYRLEKFKEAGQ